MYIKRNQPERAAKSLSKLRRLPVDHPQLVEELSEITANHEYEMSLGKATYVDCVRGNLGKRLFTGCALRKLLDTYLSKLRPSAQNGGTTFSAESLSTEIT